MNKIMKKLVTLLLSIGMLLSMAACSNSSDSKVSDESLDKLEEFIKNLSEVSSANYEAEMEVTLDKENMKLSVYGGYIVETENPLQFSLTMDMESEGSKLEKCIQLFVKDNVMYMNLLDWIKQKATLEKVMENENISNFESSADEISMNKKVMKQYLKEASLIGNTLKLSFDVDKVNKVVKKEAGKLNIKGSTENVEKMDMEITLNNGFMEKAVIFMDLTITENGVTQEFSSVISFILKDINNVDQLNFPDFSDYKETSNLV